MDLSLLLIALDTGGILATERSSEKQHLVSHPAQCRKRQYSQQGQALHVVRTIVMDPWHPRLNAWYN